MEKTLVLIKPDGVQRGLIGQIITRFERRGLKLSGLKLMQMTSELASAHYEAHVGKPFYPGLVSYITSGPIVAMVWEGKDAIQIVRTTMGATNAGAAAPGTIRGDLAVEIGRNLVHGSDGPESAAREVSLFFSAGELLDWQRETDRWIRE
ncbi:MAG: nucleoside-diphosphate kinase [Candidatus Promineofilum sp.]|nr:nucleoside-diphosphate kinase [Promineifilum sp.]MBP9657124.1 nucleoside-diphosphate kinase [Promineifilum sp.]